MFNLVLIATIGFVLSKSWLTIDISTYALLALIFPLPSVCFFYAIDTDFQDFVYRTSKYE